MANVTEHKIALNQLSEQILISKIKNLAATERKLTQVSHMQKICRQVKKDSGKIVSTQVRQDILQKIENKTSAVTQLIVAEVLNVESKKQEIIRRTFQADQSVRPSSLFQKMNTL